MVVGLDLFRETFKAETDQYVLIGGTACSLHMEEAGLQYRMTKDLDIVLCIEVMTDDFVKKLWDFIARGRYENMLKSNEERQYYRFLNPQDKTFPKMLELFSRVPDAVRFEGKGEITPIPTEESIASLSAILLDDAYYTFLMEGRQVVQNLSILNVASLIPLKAKAFLDLSVRKERGESVKVVLTNDE